MFALCLIATAFMDEPCAVDVLQRMCDARAAATSGMVETLELRDAGEGILERHERAFFDERHYRIEVWSDTGEPGAARTSAADGAPQPYLILTCDGARILERFELQHARNRELQYSIRPLDGASIPDVNLRVLDLPAPGRPVPQTALELHCHLDGEFGDVQVAESGEMTVTVRHDDPRYGLTTLWLTVDPARGWSAVRWTLVNADARVEAVFSPALLDGVWFPVWARFEYFENDAYQRSREVHVLDASFNRTLDPDLFTWRGIVREPRARIISHVPGQPHLHWTGTQAVPWYAVGEFGDGR